MSYPINYPTPQGANVQIFRGGDAGTTAHVYTRDWVKPQGASFVWFTLIGAGGGGGGAIIDSSGPTLYCGGGGASGAVTNFMCPAFLLPDVLQVAVGRGGNGGGSATDGNAADGVSGEQTLIIYQQKNGTGYQLLYASGGPAGSAALFSPNSSGIGGTGSAAATGGPMTAAGFFNATGGQSGQNGEGTATTNGTTFVMGGSGTSEYSTSITGYYGYSATLRSGYSQLSPIPLSIPGNTESSGTKFSGNSFGCGGNGGGIPSNPSATYGSRGGDGLAIIVTW